MKAIRVHAFGGPEVIAFEEIARPQPGSGEVLIRVAAAGVGPWDAWVRAGQSALPQPLPLTLGSDLAGTIEAIGADVTAFTLGTPVFGVTNAQFTGAYAEYAIAQAAMIAVKPERLGFVEAASIPVVASTAWEMLFDHGRLTAGQSVLIHGAAGNVGAFAVQFAKQAGIRVFATAYARDVDYVRGLGADRVIDVQSERFEEIARDVDVVIDTIGGDTLARSFATLKRGGALVSSVANPDPIAATRGGIRAVFFLVDVTTAGLTAIARMIDEGHIRTNVGEVLPLQDAVIAHEMLAGKPHKGGKIVLKIADQ